MKCDIPMMGEAAIEAAFGDVRAVPMRDYESVYCMEAPARVPAALEEIVIYAGSMHYWVICRAVC